MPKRYDYDEEVNIHVRIKWTLHVFGETIDITAAIGGASNIVRPKLSLIAINHEPLPSAEPKQLPALTAFPGGKEK